MRFLATPLIFTSLLFVGSHPTPAPDTKADQQPLPFVVQPPATIQLTRSLAKAKRELAAQRRLIHGLRRTLLHRPSSVEALQLTSVVYGIPYWSLYRRASCESTGGQGLNPYAKNRSSDATGLFQILVPSTWRTTPYASLSPWSPYANALAAGYMLSHGRAAEWQCPG